METQKFIHKVSKGSVYNQIYVPKNLENTFEAGDIVEVKLIKKSKSLHYHHIKSSDLSDFKNKLIENIIDLISKFDEVEQIFIFGSFLTKKSGYNDIDIMILTEKENIEEKIYNNLTEEFSLKFHVISMPKEKLQELSRIDPMIRSMLYHFVSNKNFQVPAETIVDENHLKYLLMMPEDLLKINLNDGKVFYNVLRKLVTIECFLKKYEIIPNKIDDELIKLLGINKLNFIKDNGVVKETIRNEIRKIIKTKLNLIYKELKNVKKG